MWVLLDRMGVAGHGPAFLTEAARVLSGAIASMWDGAEPVLAIAGFGDQRDLGQLAKGRPRPEHKGGGHERVFSFSVDTLPAYVPGVRLRPATLDQLARMICADPPSAFPYRSSGRLTAFFTGLDFDYVHRGETRLAWTRNALTEIEQDTPEGGSEISASMTRIIEGLLDPAHFLDSASANRAAAIDGVRGLLRSYRYEVMVDPATEIARIQFITPPQATPTVDKASGGPSTGQPNSLGAQVHTSGPFIGSPITPEKIVTESLSAMPRKGTETSIAASRFMADTNMHTPMRQIFISHAKLDEELAAAIVEYLMASLTIHDRRVILCTSLPGHELIPGDPASEHILQSIKEAGVVIGVLTPISLRRQAVMMELGAAWALDKQFIPTLYGAGFDKIPEWLNRHAISFDDSIAEFATLNHRMTGFLAKVQTSTGIAAKHGAEIGNAVYKLHHALQALRAKYDALRPTADTSGVKPQPADDIARFRKLLEQGINFPRKSVSSRHINRIEVEASVAHGWLASVRANVQRKFGNDSAYSRAIADGQFVGRADFDDRTISAVCKVLEGIIADLGE